MKSAAVLLLLLLPPALLGAAQATLSASTTTVTIGEHVDLRVVVRAEAGIENIRVKLPDGPYDIIGRRRPPSMPATGGPALEEIIVIAFFRTGEFTVGPFQVELLGGGLEPATVTTGQLAIRVRSLLNEGDTDIQPLKRPLALRGDPRHLLPYAAALALLSLLAATALLLRRREKKRRQHHDVPLPPELELEMRLGELRRRDLLRDGRFREFFIALGGILKQFIERAYGFNAVDCTTAETLAQLKDNEDNGRIVADLQEIFAQADLVKFARLVPEKNAVAAIWPQVDSLVAVHKRRRREAAEAHVQSGG